MRRIALRASPPAFGRPQVGTYDVLGPVGEAIHFDARRRYIRIYGGTSNGRTADYWAFSIDDNLRVPFRWDGDIAFLVNLGTHHEVY